MSSNDRENTDFDEKIDELKISLMIKLVRHSLGLSLKDMGTYLGVGASTVGKWENMELSIKAASLLRLQRLIANAGIDCTLHDEDLNVRFSNDTLKWMVEDLEKKRNRTSKTEETTDEEGPHIEKLMKNKPLVRRNVLENFQFVRKTVKSEPE